MATYSLAPFLVLAIANLLLIRKIMSRKVVKMTTMSSTFTNAKSTGKKSKSDRINKTVIILTLIFVMMTLPLASASFFFNQLVLTDYGLFIIVLLDCISFSYHGLNFILMAFSNKIFRKQYKKTFKIKF